MGLEAKVWRKAMNDESESIREQIGLRISVARKAARISQNDLAIACGVHRQTVSKWERGLERELAKAKRGRERVVKAIAEGLSMEDARGTLDELTRREESIRKQIREARSSDARVSEDELLAFLALVRDGEFSDKDVLDTFVDSVYLYPDKFVLTMNFTTDGSTLMEVESVLENERTAPEDGSCNLRMVGLPCSSTNLDADILYLTSGLALAVGF